MLRYSFIFFACLSCTSTYAADPPTWLIIGIGSDSCASYVLALKDATPTTAYTMAGKLYYSPANAYTQWINRYVTASNVARRPGIDQISVDSMASLFG